MDVINLEKAPAKRQRVEGGNPCSPPGCHGLGLRARFRVQGLGFLCGVEEQEHVQQQQ